MTTLRPDRAPQALRLAAYATAVAVLLYLTLAPADALPRESLWDKANHAIAWFVLTVVGIAFWPGRAWRMAGVAMAVGLLVEILQANLGYGRSGDARDLLADAVGIGAALGGWLLIRRALAPAPARARRLRPPSPAPRA